MLINSYNGIPVYHQSYILKTTPVRTGLTYIQLSLSIQYFCEHFIIRVIVICHKTLDLGGEMFSINVLHTRKFKITKNPFLFKHWMLIFEYHWSYNTTGCVDMLNLGIINLFVGLTIYMKYFCIVFCDGNSILRQDRYI